MRLDRSPYRLNGLAPGLRVKELSLERRYRLGRGGGQMRKCTRATWVLFPLKDNDNKVNLSTKLGNKEYNYREFVFIYTEKTKILFFINVSDIL